MTERMNISSGSKWEPVVGYSRAVRVGNTVHVAGTVGTEADGTLSADAGRQTERAFEIIIDALERAGAKVTDVVRTRVYMTDMADFDAVSAAHGALFGEIRPAAAFVQVAALVDPACKVEIEAEAIIAG